MNDNEKRFTEATQSDADKGEWHPLEIPECGIDFKRYHSHDCEVYVCAWHDDSWSHVYEVRMRRTENGWRAVMSNDGRKLCSMLAPTRQLAYRCALGAMRGYLKRGHRKTLKTQQLNSSTSQLLNRSEAT